MLFGPEVEGVGKYSPPTILGSQEMSNKYVFMFSCVGHCENVQFVNLFQ